MLLGADDRPEINVLKPVQVVRVGDVLGVLCGDGVGLVEIAVGITVSVSVGVGVCVGISRVAGALTELDEGLDVTVEAERGVGLEEFLAHADAVINLGEAVEARAVLLGLGGNAEEGEVVLHVGLFFLGAQGGPKTVVVPATGVEPKDHATVGGNAPGIRPVGCKVGDLVEVVVDQVDADPVVLGGLLAQVVGKCLPEGPNLDAPAELERGENDREHVLVSCEKDHSAIWAGFLLLEYEVLDGVGDELCVCLFLSIVPGGSLGVADFDILSADCHPDGIERWGLRSVELAAEELASVASEVHQLANVNPAAHVAMDEEVVELRGMLLGVDENIGVIDVRDHFCFFGLWHGGGKMII
ncbi:hypothetical protein BC936DRAFT_139122 [Jimgerdemannia flammicorona]|uniref:Uncharacterized protein n=1 Tax=Jimgerdemannia flammicorona TaxID=994334 RepID=A0A433BAM7_9FUNG|nr:hypothetical protein BC936DRAFT_139122 [Jimgerdemannia flammicorona]